MNMNRLWDLKRRCPDCEGIMSKSSWTRETAIMHDREWVATKTSCSGWKCDNCTNEIVWESEVENEQ